MSTSTLQRAEEDRFREGLSERIELAWQLAGYASRAEMGRQAGLKNLNTLHRWVQGTTTPSVPGLAAIAKACRVSLDWLVWGEEHTPGAFFEWLETPEGQNVTEQERAFLRGLSLHGHVPRPAFYSLALQAYRLGLTPEDVAVAARVTERLADAD